MSAAGSVDDWVCGVDEAGRGPLAGPVVAAAVVLDPDHPIPGLRDSKRLSASQRDRLAMLIRAQARAWSVASASVEEIDTLNILKATLLAMKRAVEGLPRMPVCALVDGNQAPALGCPVQLIVRGDASEPAISAASILAKTVRDGAMDTLHVLHPGYGFDQHKGYPTAEHLSRLQTLGPTAAHRRSFAPVRSVLLARGIGSDPSQR